MVFQWVIVLRWLSALYFAFEGLAVTEFKNLTFNCASGLDAGGLTFLRTLLPNSRFLAMPVVDAALTRPGEDCVANMDAVLQYYSFARPFSTTVAILIGYWSAVHMLTYAAMLLVARRERR